MGECAACASEERRGDVQRCGSAVAEGHGVRKLLRVPCASSTWTANQHLLLFSCGHVRRRAWVLARSCGTSCVMMALHGHSTWNRCARMLAQSVSVRGRASAVHARAAVLTEETLTARPTMRVREAGSLLRATSASLLPLAIAPMSARARVSARQMHDQC